MLSSRKMKAMIEPLKLGLKLEPPTLLLIYKMWGKLRMRSMPIRNLWPTTSTKFILEDIRTRHEILLGVPDETIMKMIDILKASKGGMDLEDAIAKFSQVNSRDDKIDENHNDSTSLGENRVEDKMSVDGLNKPKIIKEDVENVDKKKDKPYSFMDKRLADEDTDFDPNDDLPLDELDGHSDDDFWR